MDTASWTCSCGEEIFGDSVVDHTFIPRIEEHIKEHKVKLKPKCSKIEFEPSIIFGRTNIYKRFSGNGSLLHLSDSELQQLFDGIVDIFDISKSSYISEFYGYWDKEDWGVDPRKVK